MTRLVFFYSSCNYYFFVLFLLVRRNAPLLTYLFTYLLVYFLACLFPSVLTHLLTINCINSHFPGRCNEETLNFILKTYAMMVCHTQTNINCNKRNIAGILIFSQFTRMHMPKNLENASAQVLIQLRH